MADYKHDANDEYMPDDDAVSNEVYETGESAISPGPAGGGRMRRILLIGLAIMVSFAVTHFMRGKAKQKTAEPEVVAQAPAEPVVDKSDLADLGAALEGTSAEATKVKVAKPMPAKPTASLQLPVAGHPEVVALQEKVGQVGQRFSRNEAEIRHLKVSVEHVEDSISALDDTITDLSFRIDALSKTLKQLQAAAVAKQQKAAQVAPKKPDVVFHLKAAVRGRAWLQDLQGRNFSVKMGDSVPPLGRVILIDPIQGVVLTDKDAIITYGENDH